MIQGIPEGIAGGIAEGIAEGIAGGGKPRRPQAVPLCGD